MEHVPLPQRKNPRMSDYDYSAPGYYFVTICTHSKKCIFGEAGNLNQLGTFAQRGVDLIPQHFPGVEVNKYIVMPNHVHLILILSQSGYSLSTVIGSYKSYVSKNIHRIDPHLKVWQTSFHDHIIQDRQGYETIWSYIDANPQNWKDDCFFAADYLA